VPRRRPVSRRPPVAGAGDRVSLPAGPRAPAALQTLGWFTRPGPFMERCRARYGDTFTLRLLNEDTWVMLTDPEDVKVAFTGDATLMHAGEANAILRPVVGPRSILLLDEGAHLTQRKLLLPPFHGERMARYGAVMRAAAEREIASWPADEPLPVWQRMQDVTLEVIVRAVFGVVEPGELARLRALLGGMLDWTVRPRQMFSLAVLGAARVERNRLFRRVLDPIDAALGEIITRRRADPDLAARDDILSMLLQARHEDGAPMTDAELRDELMTLLVAGHETTATSLAWAVERLVRHPDALERVRAEVAAGEDAYLDAVVKETLRLRPVLPIVLRRLTAPLTLGGHELPAGVSLAPCIFLVHRREDIYPEPHAFRPERFLEHPAGTYTWIPFGGGVRRCLGAAFAQFEMKVVLSALVASARLAPVRPAGERIARRTITLTPARGAEVVREAA
jgi:cytochrome P450 family 135